jgi:hypothetical protein
VPKHVGVGYSSRIVRYELYFLYYCLHSLLDLVSGILEDMFKKNLTPGFYVKPSRCFHLWHRCVSVCVNITDLPSFFTGRTLYLDRVCTSVHLAPCVLESLTHVFCLGPVRVFMLWVNNAVFCTNFRSRVKIRRGKHHTFLVCLRTAPYKKCRDVAAKCHAFFIAALILIERHSVSSSCATFLRPVLIRGVPGK